MEHNCASIQLHQSIYAQILGGREGGEGKLDLWEEGLTSREEGCGR